MKQNEDINDLLARHLAHESMTDGQQQQLDAWIEAHPKEYRQLKRLTDVLRPQADEASFDARRAWLKVEPRLKGKTVELHRKRRFVTFCSIAASLLLLLATATIYLLERPAVHYVNNGRTARHLLLPDSSEVTLYPKTTLSFRYGAHRSERLARLEGKAFFHVKKAGGKPFRVETEEVEVEVLGTSFLVDATHTERTAVFVESGHVKVTADENDLELHAHEKAELSDGSLQKGVIDDPATFFNHKKPKMVFNQTPIGDVIKEVEKQTGIRIELGRGVEENTVTTRIDPDNAESIAAELAFLCGCKCDTLKRGKLYRLHYD